MMNKTELIEAIKKELKTKLQESSELLDSQPQTDFDLEDQIGSFWLVKKAMRESTDEDMICEVDIFSLAEMIKGGLTKENINGFYKSENKARSSSKKLLRQRDTQLKEDIKTASSQTKELQKKIEDIKLEIASRTSYATDNPGSRDAVSADLETLYKKLTKLEDLKTRLKSSLEKEKQAKKDKKKDNE